MPDGLALSVFGVKLVFLIATLVTAGGGLAVALGGPLARRVSLGWVCSAVAISALAYGVSLIALNAQLSGSWSAALDPVTFGWIWPSRQSQAFVLAAGLLAGIAPVIRPARIVGVLSAVLISVSLALSGHASGLEPSWLAQAAIAIHVLTASFWIIAPPLLWPSPSLSEDAARLRQFSRLAIWWVPVVFILGAYLALRLSGGPTDLVTTPYGQLLLAKLAVATVALALGAINKQVVSRRFDKAPHNARQLLRLTLSADIVLFFTAFALVAWATTISGPSA